MTYTELTAWLQDHLQNSSSEFVAAIPNLVRLAEDRIYSSVQIPALRKNSTSAFDVGNKYLQNPEDFLSAYSMAVVTSGVYSYLLEREVSFIGEAYPVPATTGVPRFYAIFNETTFLIAPTPSAASTVELHYYYKPESIVTAGTNWLGDNVESILFYACMVEAYIYMKGDTELMNFYAARYSEGINRLKILGEGFSKKDSFKLDLPKVVPV